MAARETVDLWKSVFDLVRAAAITALILIFLAKPVWINHGLAAIGVTEFDLWGLKGKTTIVEVTETAKDQLAQIATMKDQLQRTADLLQVVTKERDELKARAQSTAGLPPPIPASQIQQTLKASLDAVASATKAADATNQVLRSNATTIAAAQTAVADEGSGWVVLFGSDASESEARNEAARARIAGFAPRIYHYRNRYRSAVWFAQLTAARAALSTIQGLSSTASDAYIASIATWCPQSRQTKPDVWECS